MFADNSCNHATGDAANHTSPAVGNAAVVRRLKVASVLCGIFLILEVVGGCWAHSLAVLSDAAHLVADLAGFLVALGASHLASLPATPQHTYGLQRTESLAALLSMLSLAYVSLWLAWEAAHRLYTLLYHSEDILAVNGGLMSVIATIGVLVNVVLAIVLGEHHVHLPGGGGHNHDHSHDHHDEKHHEHHPAVVCSEPKLAADEETHLLQQHHHPDEVDPILDQGTCCGHDHGHDHGHGHNHKDDHEPIPSAKKHDHDHHDAMSEPQRRRNVNLHAAYIHVLGDLAQSTAVLIAGLVIWFQPTWHWVDPVVTLLFCALVFYSTLGVIRSSIAILPEEVPPHIGWNPVYQAIAAVPAVERVHDLHIWSISDGVPALSVHCFLRNGHNDSAEALQSVYKVCRQHGIQHATIQIQCPGEGNAADDEVACITCQDDKCEHYSGDAIC